MPESPSECNARIVSELRANKGHAGWTTLRGVEAFDYSYALMDLTVYGRQEPWEDSPPNWPQQCTYIRTAGGPPDWSPVPTWPGGRPIAQWSRLAAGRSDDLGPAAAQDSSNH